jgi:pyruvate/2-oxoacid:ferredoxin oxidoreductase alpha subunit
MLAVELTFKYRSPVIILGDGYLGQMTGKVNLPDHMIKPGIPKWAVNGDAEHRGNLINSIVLSETDLEAHNVYLNDKYRQMAEHESRCETFMADDAEILVIATNTPARASKGAVQDLRNQGVKAGLFRPITVWPFPVKQLLKELPHVKRIVVVEASNGQLEDEIRLALSLAGHQNLPVISSVRHFGGILPQQAEVVAHIKASLAKEVR